MGIWIVLSVCLTVAGRAKNTANILFTTNFAEIASILKGKEALQRANRQ
jgi:hypothetical protein